MEYLENIIQRVPKALRIIRQTSYESIVRRKFTMPPELRKAHKLGEALDCIKRRWPNLSNSTRDSEYPVFIFSAGWRSGSTLMQRIVTSSKEVVIWGEPLGDSALIPRLGSAVSRISLTWPPDEFFDDDPNLSSLSEKWVANLSPPISYLRSSHRSIFQEWLGVPAKKRYGLSRWGLKEVRLTIDHARYLKWLFPNARFIFIFRNVFDAYRSWKGNLWGDIWPGYYSRSPIAFARHWRLLLEGFCRGYQDVDGKLVKFEDLISGDIDLDEIADYVGVQKVDSSVLEKKIGTPTPQRRRAKRKINVWERAILSYIGKPLLVQLGYRAKLSSKK